MKGIEFPWKRLYERSGIDWNLKHFEFPTKCKAIEQTANCRYKDETMT